ncbi:hypothetical protein [Candidatus Protochlamydia phocaeensis]|uniref:hypothetical protein n=1 Tax=Candidatus Protochlamydia phocaeensis TaxID=1414722 RepID=UPI00083842B2|nr:hypothetical protein [Candidatus Protochlamydia phocaeensis]
MASLNLLRLFGLSIMLSSLFACQRGPCCNRWAEKDCYYSDYYQSAPSPSKSNYYSTIQE